MPVPLRKLKPDGTLYQRRTEIESSLDGLLQLSRSAIGDRCQVDDPGEPGHLPSECLLHLIRTCRSDNSDRFFATLFRVLRQRVLGDKMILLFSDDQRRMSLRLTEANHDLEKGLLSSTSPLGKAVHGAEEGEEVEFDQEGRKRKALIEVVDKGWTRADVKSPINGERLTSAA